MGESEGFLPLSLLCTHFSRPCILGLQSQLLAGLSSVLPVAQPVPVPGIMGRDDQTLQPYEQPASESKCSVNEC